MDIFTRKGELRHIHKLKMWKLENVLADKYGFKTEDAIEISGFLMPMLNVNPSKRLAICNCRASAAQILNNVWIRDAN